MRPGRIIVTAVLIIANIASALSVVYGAHMNRKLHIALQKEQIERDRLNMEWGQLQLEQSTYATHNKIEQMARDKLGMMTPDAGKVEHL